METSRGKRSGERVGEEEDYVKENGNSKVKFTVKRIVWETRKGGSQSNIQEGEGPTGEVSKPRE